MALSAISKKPGMEAIVSWLICFSDSEFRIPNSGIHSNSRRGKQLPTYYAGTRRLQRLRRLSDLQQTRTNYRERPLPGEDPAIPALRIRDFITQIPRSGTPDSKASKDRVTRSAVRVLAPQGGLADEHILLLLLHAGARPEG